MCRIFNPFMVNLERFFELLFEPYTAYTTVDITLELLGVLFGFLSVVYAKKNSIAVYPTGIISTGIFVYILWKFGLLGDMLINAYYFVMSIYGWYFWTRSKAGVSINPMARMNREEHRLSVAIFVSTLFLVFLIYNFSNRWNSLTAYLDTLTTAIFFVGMWLMARRKIEHWIFWIIGDLISVPLYVIKGLSLTAFQYFIFTFVAILGYISWRKTLIKLQPTA